MFFNVFIKIDGRDQLTTDCFYYDAERHYLNYHCPYQDKDGWISVSNVECKIQVDRPMIYIQAKTLKGGNIKESKPMKIKRLKELIKNVSDDTEVYFMFGLNDKYKDKENGVFTLKENGESSSFENKIIFTLKDTE